MSTSTPIAAASGAVVRGFQATPGVGDPTKIVLRLTAKLSDLRAVLTPQEIGALRQVGGQTSLMIVVGLTDDNLVLLDTAANNSYPEATLLSGTGLTWPQLNAVARQI